MKRVLLASVGVMALMGAGATSAADLGARVARAPAPAYAPAYNWTGLYVGINGGGAWGTSRWTDNVTGATSGDFNLSGGMVGGTLGYNWQTGPVVFGIETDLDWTNISGSTACGVIRCETSNSWLGTTRGRLGYAVNQFMPFVTGGVAYGDTKISNGVGSAATATQVGYAVGGGVEFAFNGPWTAKVEYLYVDLGKATCDVTCSGSNPFDVKFNTSVVRGGLNYRF